MTQDNAPTLEPKHQRFVEEYLVDFNATQAFIRAGYPPRNASQNVWRLMRNPAVRAAIAAGQRRLAEACRVSAEAVIAQYARIAFASMRDYVEVREDGTVRFDLSDVPAEKWAAIADIKTADYELRSGGRVTRMRLKLACKLHALDSLSRHLGLFAGPADDPALRDRDLAEELRQARERAENWESRFPAGD